MKSENNKMINHQAQGNYFQVILTDKDAQRQIDQNAGNGLNKQAEIEINSKKSIGDCDSDLEDLQEEDDLINVKKNKIGDYGEEIFIYKTNSQISLIVNYDKNHFIERATENITSKSNKKQIN